MGIAPDGMLGQPASRLHRGFTLIELLVVISIIVLMVAMLLPVLSQARAQAKVTMCLANLRGFVQSATIYAEDHRQTYPAGTYFNSPFASSKNVALNHGALLLPYSMPMISQYCPLGTWAGAGPAPAGMNEYDLRASIFPWHTVPMINNQYNGYFYFGNHSIDPLPLENLLNGASGEGATSVQLYRQGRMYPYEAFGPRAKLFQDFTGDRGAFTYVGHNGGGVPSRGDGSVNSAYTDGSVVGEKIREMGAGRMRGGWAYWW